MNQNASDRIYRVDLTDAAGVVHASFEKTIHICYKRYVILGVDFWNPGASD